MRDYNKKQKNMLKMCVHKHLQVLAVAEYNENQQRLR